MASMPVHRFAGSPFEMGRQQGEALAGPIRESRRTLLGLERFQLLRPRWVPMPMFEFMSRRRARRLVEEPLRRYYPDQAVAFDGLARGSSQSLGQLLLLASAEILLSKIDYRLAPAAGACSAAAVRTAQGVVLQKNFDYPAPIQPYYFVRSSRPDSGYATLEFTVAPLAGTVDGLNERGLAVTYNYGFCVDPVRHYVPLSIALNEMLRTCATVEEAVEFLSSRPRSGGALLMLADAGGAMASVELSNTRIAVRRASGGWIAHTNHYRDPELVEVEIPHGAVYSELNVRVLRGSRIHESSVRRGKRLEELFGGPGATGPDEVWARLSDHEGGAGGDFTVCRHGPYWETTASVQLVPARREIRVCWDKPCRAAPVPVQLDGVSAAA
jgi:hypothetical protein